MLPPLRSRTIAGIAFLSWPSELQLSSTTLALRPEDVAHLRIWSIETSWPVRTLS